MLKRIISSSLWSGLLPGRAVLGQNNEFVNIAWKYVHRKIHYRNITTLDRLPKSTSFLFYGTAKLKCPLNVYSPLLCNSFWNFLFYSKKVCQLSQSKRRNRSLHVFKSQKIQDFHIPERREDMLWLTRYHGAVYCLTVHKHFHTQPSTRRTSFNIKGVSFPKHWCWI